MTNTRMFLCTILPLLYACAQANQGCMIKKPNQPPHYVCFDGRSLDLGSQGYNWNAKRGCFVSRMPCCMYEATQYGYYPDTRRVFPALAECQHGYPYHWGEMQTH